MAEDEEQRPESLLPYNEWTADALRHVVVSAVRHAAEHGLPGEHHFYITFRTDHPGTVIPPRLRAQYPQMMTIVLQHQFWDLQLDEAAGLITVGLSFGGVPATLAVPLEAVTAFADPHVRFSLQFRAGAADEQNEQEEPPAAGEPAAREPGETPPPVHSPPDEQPPQVVSLDAFRRRPPPKT